MSIPEPILVLVGLVLLAILLPFVLVPTSAPDPNAPTGPDLGDDPT